MTTKTTANAAAGARPRRSAAAVASLTEMIRAACADADATRALPAAVTAALRDAGVFRLLAPRESAAPRPTRSPSSRSSRRPPTPTARSAGA